MPQKKHKPEEIVAKLRQVDVLVLVCPAIFVGPCPGIRGQRWPVMPN
jgi:hypothetical protein